MTGTGPRSPQEMLGRIFERRYVVRRALGEGGAGAVWLAKDEEADDLVALKTVHALDESHGDRGHEVAQRFEREAQMLTQLRHPNIVETRDFFITDDGLMVLVLEFLEGETLRTTISGHGAMGWPFALRIVEDICKGLVAAHDMGVVHRDLKPENCCRITTEDGELTKVLDFGAAKNVFGSAMDSLTRTGTFLGTPSYVSPEQCMGKAADFRADIYSTSVVLFELLTGKVPFYGGAVTKVLMKHVHEVPAAPSSLVPSVPPAVDAIVATGLAKAPEDRFDGMRRMLSAVRDALSDA